QGLARYEGPRHFDAHAYRTEDEDGVWDFARGCMRTYKILKARATAFDQDPEVLELLPNSSDAALDALTSAYSREAADRLRAMDLQPDERARRGLRYERLDQLLTEHLMGVRG
ncbi:MAG: xylose isomerase, partial [Planctomycetota bacterium]